MDNTAKKILSDLKSGKYAPVYALQGEEVYYIDLISGYIEANALSDSEKSFNQVIVYGKDAPMHVILTHARRFPMMAERQVVIVKEAQDIQDLQKESGARLLLDYIMKPVPSTVLVLCHMHKPFDKRKELGKKIDQLTVSANFKRPYDYQLPDFILEYVKEKGITIEDEAVRVLSEYVGSDLSRLANEIDKVLIGIEKGNAITAKEVMAQVGISREYNIFELQKALIKKDTLQAAKIINYFERNTRKNPMIPMVAYLFSFFSKLLVASTAPDKRESSLVSHLKINPFAAKDYSIALKQFSTQHLAEIVGYLKEADLKLKGVNAASETEGQIVKELVFKMMRD